VSAREENAVSWTWRFEKADGTPVRLDFDVPEFGAQGDAESWLGEVWREMANTGAEQATLLEDGRVVYGPMSLSPE
jgi:hypothetical protein